MRTPPRGVESVRRSLPFLVHGWALTLFRVGLQLNYPKGFYATTSQKCGAVLLGSQKIMVNTYSRSTSYHSNANLPRKRHSDCPFRLSTILTLGSMTAQPTIC